MGAVNGSWADMQGVSVMADKESLTGLTESEAMEVHKYMVQGYIAFVAVAVVAHILVWNWRPWFAPLTGWK
jgi:light-harvesting complex 1 beta chain